MADTVRVWVRSLGNSCRVSVDNLSGVALVLDRLSHTDVLKGVKSVSLTVELKDSQQPSESNCTIELGDKAEHTLAALEIALSDAPDVELMLAPGR